MDFISTTIASYFLVAASSLAPAPYPAPPVHRGFPGTPQDLTDQGEKLEPSGEMGAAFRSHLGDKELQQTPSALPGDSLHKCLFRQADTADSRCQHQREGRAWYVLLNRYSRLYLPK